MIINSIIQVNIGYIPGYNCSKDRKTHHPLCRWCVFLSGGLGGVAHEQVAPMAQTMRRKQNQGTGGNPDFISASLSAPSVLPAYIIPTTSERK